MQLGEGGPDSSVRSSVQSGLQRGEYELRVGVGRQRKGSGRNSTVQGQELVNDRKVWLGETGYGEKLFFKKKDKSSKNNNKISFLNLGMVNKINIVHEK